MDRGALPHRFRSSPRGETSIVLDATQQTFESPWMSRQYAGAGELLVDDFPLRDGQERGVP